MIDFSKILKSEKTDFLKNYLNTGTKFKDKYGNGIYLGTKMISEQGGIEYTVEKIDGDILTLVAEDKLFHDRPINLHYAAIPNTLWKVALSGHSSFLTLN